MIRVIARTSRNLLAQNTLKFSIAITIKPPLSSTKSTQQEKSTTIKSWTSSWIKITTILNTCTTLKVQRSSESTALRTILNITLSLMFLMQSTITYSLFNIVVFSLILLPYVLLLFPLCLRAWVDYPLPLWKRTSFTQVQRRTRFKKISHWRIKVKIPINIDVLLVNCVLQPALPTLLQSRVSLDLMVPEERLDTISIWPNAFIVDFAKRHAQWMLS